MLEVDPPSSQEFLAAENVSLRLLLTQAEVSAQTLLAQAGIDAKEREASDKLQKLIWMNFITASRTRLRRLARLSPKAFVMHRARNMRSRRSKVAC